MSFLASTQSLGDFKDPNQGIGDSPLEFHIKHVRKKNAEQFLRNNLTSNNVESIA